MRRMQVTSQVITVALYVGFVVYVVAKLRPIEAARIRHRLQLELARMQWRDKFDTLPTWLQEAAVVRGWAPDNAGTPITVAEAPISEPS